MLVPLENEFDRLFRLVSKGERIKNSRLRKSITHIRSYLLCIKFLKKEIV